MNRESGVPTADYKFAYNMEDVENAVNMRYPLIIKHWNGPGGSEGLSTKSRVTDSNQLLSQSKFMIDKYKGCLIEEFIDGKDHSPFSFLFGQKFMCCWFVIRI
jgi:phosphoribosylamine-glycine ligase